LKTLFPLHGIVTVLNTPFTHDDKIDYAALRLNVKEALQAGAAGFLVPAMASEVQKLSASERLGMVEAVLVEVGGQVPVFAGTASSNAKESGELLNAYQSLGCHHFLIQLPAADEEQFKSEFYRLADLGPEVIMLQDWDAQGDGLPDKLIFELFENVPAFRCLKVETIPAGVKYSRILNMTQGKLNVSGGWAVAQMPEALQRGVHAFMPTGMHWIYTRIFNAYTSGNIEEAIALFNKILPVLAFSNQHLDISIHFFKRLLWKQGIYPTPKVRTPILPFDQIHQELADMLIDRIIEMEKQIKDNA
jgi:dihydrodipicolinate synthase/N-acetylneuraminate lyase